MAISRRTKLDLDIFTLGPSHALLPSVDDKDIVDSDDVDVFHSFSLEIGVSLNVTWHLGRASRGEGSWDKDEDALSIDFGEVDSVFKIVDSHIDVWDGISRFGLCVRSQRGESRVSGLSSLSDDRGHFGCGSDKSGSRGDDGSVGSCDCASEEG